jgi:DNA-binding transcriptional LysR family regulator
VAEALTDEALRSVADGAHDIAVVAHAGPQPVLPGTLEGETLGTEPIVAAVHRRFVEPGSKTVSWATIPWVVLTRGTATRTIFDRHLAGIAANVRCEVEDADTSRLLVEAGIGAALLPAGLCDILDQERALVAPPPGGPDEIGIAVVVDGARELSPAAQAMRTQLLDPTASARWSAARARQPG